MRITTVVFLVVVTLLTASAGAEVIRVVPLDLSDNAVFSCGDRCKFRGSLPTGPLRVRIIRGSVSELSAIASDRRYAAAGCIELYSTIVRPRRSRRTADLLDLKFYFNTRWLASGGSNGQFVFIVEHDSDPNGPAIEKTAMLRLPAGPRGAAYFRAGVDVAVRTPMNVPGRQGFLVKLFRSTAKASASMTTTRLAAESSPATEDTPLPAAMPRATSPANCVDLQIEQPPVIFRRADAVPRKRPVHVAVK
ncbi:MAG: hypothetical protein ABI779_11855 [Acidobacteriota bacterium]